MTFANVVQAYGDASLFQGFGGKDVWCISVSGGRHEIELSCSRLWHGDDFHLCAGTCTPRCCPTQNLTCPGASLLHQPEQPLLLEDDAAANEETGEDSQAQTNVESIVTFQPCYPGGIPSPIVMARVSQISTSDHLAHNSMGKAWNEEQRPCENMEIQQLLMWLSRVPFNALISLSYSGHLCTYMEAGGCLVIGFWDAVQAAHWHTVPAEPFAVNWKTTRTTIINLNFQPSMLESLHQTPVLWGWTIPCQCPVLIQRLWCFTAT